MKRWFRKRLMPFLLAVVMVMTMVPAVSAASSSTDTVTCSVTPGGTVALNADDFEKVYSDNCSGTFQYVVFDRPSTSNYNDGYLCYRYGTSREYWFSRSELNDYEFYFSNSSYGDYPLSDLSFAADDDFSDTVTLSFTVYGSGSRSADGELVISKATTVSGGTISYTVAAGKEVKLDEDDFDDFYSDNCSGSFRYVTFDRPSTSNYADGYMYDRYGTSRETYFTRSELEDYKFYYDDSDYGDYALDNLSFVAEDDFKGPVKVAFTAYGSGGRSVSGTLVINSSGASSKGDLTYTVAPGGEVELDADDFEDFYDDNCSGTFRYVVFDKPASADYADGYMYDRYGTSRQTYFTRSELDDCEFYFDDSAYGDYALEDLSFVADKNFEGPVKLTFTAYGSSNRSVKGTLVINSSSASSKGDVTYTVAPGGEVELDIDDFEDFYEDNCSGSFRYVIFDKPTSADYADGYLYDRYGTSRETYFTRATLGNVKFYFDDADYGDYDLADLSFVADSDFESPVKLTFTAYGSGSRSASGTLVINSSGTVSAGYKGNIRYTTTPGTALQINANDIARFYKKYTGSDLKYFALTAVPSTGGLFYNYYGTSNYGSSTRFQLTSSSAVGKIFSYSPASTAEYAMTELTYIPSGSNYCTAISFTTYGTGGQTVSGTILISVNTSAVSEIYSVTTRGTSVTFPASTIYSAVSSATGLGLSGIQLLELPASSVGTVYANNTLANVTSTYSYAGTSPTMSQLRFVPNSSFTGSVSIPYVALNASGTAIASGTFSIGVVNSVKRFSDITSSTWCYKYVTELSDSGIISGYSDGTFQEKNTITYGAALKLIMLAAGYEEQAPTVKNSTFSGYLAKAKADGLVTGSPNLSGSITRLQIAQIAAKAMKLSTSSLSAQKPFTDTDDVYVQALNAAGIVEGYFSNGTSTYKPNNTLTRGQVSAIVWRMRNYNS